MNINHRFRLSEYPIIAQFILKSFETDQEKFNSKYTRYDEAYLASFKEAITAVQQIETQRTAMQKLKEYTQGVLYPLADNMTILLNDLKGYFRHAGVEMPPIQESIKQFKSRDIEDALDLIQTVYESMERNKTILEKEGMSTAVFNEFNATKIAINDAKIIQNDLKNQRIVSTEEKSKKYSTLWNIIKEISKDGKELFKENKEKANQYTFSHLKKRMRNEYKQPLSGSEL